MVATAMAVGKAIAQSKFADRATLKAWPQATLYWVDPTNGNNGNDGLDHRHPVATLAQAHTLASDGDVIALVPGGSETVTATVTLSKRVKVICPVDDPRQGYTITGAGTLDLVTVSTAGVVLEGLKLVHTGATSSAAGVLLAAGADRAVVRNCLLDDSAIVTTFTGKGVEVTDACNDILIEDNLFLDCKYGVEFVVATGIVCLRPRLRGNTFYVGRSAAFAVATTLTGTGAVRGLHIFDDLILEANGDGSAAASAWDGSDNSDATQGTYLFGAAVDQYLIANCRAYTALAQTFVTLGAVNAGAAGDFATCATGTGGDTSSAVDSVGTLVSSALSATVSYGTAGSTANSSTLSAVVSYGTAGSTANSSSLSAIVSYGTAGSTANSSSLSAVVSYGTAGSTANSAALSSTVSLAASVATVLSTIESKVDSVGAI